MMKSETRRRLANGQLKKLGRLGSSSILAVRDALWDSDWKVRRNALRVLDHVPGEESLPRIVELLRDENEEVRKWAAHVLGCDRCKSGAGREVDPVPFLIDSARQDPSLAVRRSAVVCLAWNRPVDPRIHFFLQSLADSSDDPKILLHAQEGVKRHAVPANAA